ncbi:MAG: folylpolyglutamate synthase/dihydrofolate synthase family protein [Myxococcaceae bacterium]
MMTSYETALKRLFDLSPLPKLGLERMSLLMADLGNPQNTYPAFHVAGTNGKGSTCAFLEAILRSAGYKTGLYTSPHLTCARERIQINRELISEEDFVRLEQKVSLNATFFERMTAMAFLYFAEQKVDVAVIEVGLGGRLDATNIIKPIVCGISRIDLDHQNILGDTLEQIAVEKAGIIKSDVPVCWSPQDPVVEHVLRSFSPSSQGGEELGVRSGLELGLHGLHQKDNALLAVNMIQASGISVSEFAMQNGLKNTKWPCRYELISENILLDGAHNPAGTKALINALPKQNFVLWVGMTEGHGGEEIARLWADFAPNSKVFVGQSKSLRALPTQIVKQYFETAGFKRVSCDNPTQQDALLVVTGSLYWAGEIRSRLTKMPVDSFSTYY